MVSYLLETSLQHLGELAYAAEEVISTVCAPYSSVPSQSPFNHAPNIWSEMETCSGKEEEPFKFASVFLDWSLTKEG